MSMSLEKEILAKTFICLLRDKQRLKRLFNFSRKILILFTEASAKAKQEEEPKSHINFPMLISKESITTLLRKREWIWVF